MEYAIGHIEIKPKKVVFKLCKECGAKIPARKKQCECGFVFYEKTVKSAPKNHHEITLSEVRVGEEIYILSDDRWVSPASENTSMSESGKFQVIKITEQGILCHNKYGYTFFDTVNEGYNPKTGITRGKTRIFKRGRNPQSKR